MSWTSGEIIRSIRVEDRTQRNQVSGYVGLNGVGNVTVDVRPICNFTYWNAAWSDKVFVSGIFSQISNELQTVYDVDLTSGNGYIVTSTNLNQIKWPNLKLCAGTYNIKITDVKSSSCGILQTYHGSVDLGSIDRFNTSTMYNQTITSAYVLTQNRTADFKIGVNGTSGTTYNLYLSKIEIIRTD